MLADEAPASPLLIDLAGLPVDQAKAIRTLVDALSYTERQRPVILNQITYAGEPREDMEDACEEA